VVLTDCVLMDPRIEMDGLVCDPFLGTTWLLLWDFPLASYTNFSIDTAESYDNMLDSKVFWSSYTNFSIDTAREL
jgi:xyloglucan fucosyltransferase